MVLILTLWGWYSTNSLLCIFCMITSSPYPEKIIRYQGASNTGTIVTVLMLSVLGNVFICACRIILQDYKHCGKFVNDEIPHLHTLMECCHDFQVCSDHFISPCDDLMRSQYFTSSHNSVLSISFSKCNLCRVCVLFAFITNWGILTFYRDYQTTP